MMQKTLRFWYPMALECKRAATKKVSLVECIVPCRARKPSYVEDFWEFSNRRQMDKLNGMGFADSLFGFFRGTAMSVITDMISRVLDVRSMTASDLPRILQLEKQRLGSSWLREDLAMNPVTEE